MRCGRARRSPSSGAPTGSKRPSCRRPVIRCTRSPLTRCRDASRSIFFAPSRVTSRERSKALALLAAARPDLVVATGGYVCFPVALAARIRKLVGLSRAPIVLLEPNLAPGVTTRLLAPIVDEIWGECGGFARRLRAKCRPTGVPIRSSLRSLPSRAEAASRLGLDPAKPVLLAIGGSQGARAINDALVAALQSGALPA
jgi:UDP-N-acetylglucosamine:LPS N-acetylglucosamine transferase